MIRASAIRLAGRFADASTLPMRRLIGERFLHWGIARARFGARRAAPLGLVLVLFSTSLALARTDPADLLAGAKWQYSRDEGATFTDAVPTVTGGERAPVWARAEFHVGSTDGLATLELTNDLISSWQKTFYLNDREIVPLQPVMGYTRYPAIDPAWLKPGRNVLAARVIADARRRDVTFQPTIRLVGLGRDALAIEIGPVLGAIGPDWFTVTCRTNMKVPVHLVRQTPNGTDTLVAKSEPGIFHRFKVPQRPGDSREFALIPEGSTRRSEFQAPSLPIGAGGKLRFVATSDPQSEIPQWTMMSNAIAAARPDFVVFAGDLVGAGRNDASWKPEFFDPARALLASVPTYMVHGNHEGQAPVVEEYFFGPDGPDGRARNWVQRFGDVTLIGVDQWIHLNWDPGSDNVRWFERALAEADTKFVFVVMHYPAYSSCSHGKLAEDGLPAEKEVRRSREVLLPLMQKHRATALISGHDHYYERTELPDGFLQIITGGAGRSTDGQSRAAKQQNPYSKFHAAVNHYSLFEVENGRCTMRAIHPDGTVLDTIEFKPRAPRR